jgi:hypothetical protein
LFQLQKLMNGICVSNTNWWMELFHQHKLMNGICFSNTNLWMRYVAPNRTDFLWDCWFLSINFHVDLVCFVCLGWEIFRTIPDGDGLWRFTLQWTNSLLWKMDHV